MTNENRYEQKSALNRKYSLFMRNFNLELEETELIVVCANFSHTGESEAIGQKEWTGVVSKIKTLIKEELS